MAFIKHRPNPFDYVIWDVLENKTNATSYQNISLLRTAIEEEGYKMSEEFILKVCKLFWRRVDRLIEKKMVAILSKFTVLCLLWELIKISKTKIKQN